MSRQPKKPKQHPNRIAELTRAHGSTYQKIADRFGVHYTTIARLATGAQELTLDWINRFAEFFGVTPAEIISDLPTAGLRLVAVVGHIHAGKWSVGDAPKNSENNERNIMVPLDPKLSSVNLYALEIADESMNERYRRGSVVVVSPIVGTSPAEIAEGRRYHVITTNERGERESTIRTLVKSDNAYWLKFESDRPEFKQWTPLDGQTGGRIELVGRVRYAVNVED